MIKRQLILIALSAVTAFAQASDTLTLTLSQTIVLAQEQSSEAQAARHTYLAAEWNYKYYRANYLPSVTFTSSPSLNRVISKITLPDGSSTFVKQNQLSTDASLRLTQNIPLTGGQIFLNTSLQRQDEFENKTVAYSSQPVVIGYQQSLFGYNSLKWDRRIEPLRYREAKKTYNETMELIASRASTYFFSLASAQTELDIAEYNYASADTLSRYARGRYDIGTITESEMLQLELNKLTEETNVLNARTNLENVMQTVRSFLALDNTTDIRVKVESDVPDIKIDLAEALRLAHENSPEPDTYERHRRESRSNLAYARANAGLKADLYVQFGLSQTADNLHDSYRNPQNQQYASIGISLPILDWGRGKGRVRVAQSNVDLVDTQVDQAMKDFDINVSKMVRQFNLQAYRVQVAEKTAALARQRYDVARRLYILGKSTILDFNAATSEKDSALRSHISALQTYWSLYYGLRSMMGRPSPDPSLYGGERTPSQPSQGEGVSKVPNDPKLPKPF